MFSTKSLFAATAALSFITPSFAQNSVYNPTGKTNLVVYWGSGENQADLINYCNVPEIDIIVIGFHNVFPPAGNGYPGNNFGNKCWATTYQGPGYNGKYTPGNDRLFSACPTVQAQIPQCQAKGKKILLSIGGQAKTNNPFTQVPETYVGQLKNAADGTYFANWMWNAYGPKNPSYLGPRPLDRGQNNATASITIDIDGFDFDIEGTVNGIDSSVGETAAYIAAIKRLRTLMDAQTANTGKKYLLSAAPQCSFNSAGKEVNMDAMLYHGGFDIIFIQFYNQGANSCTARSRANGGSGFNWEQWHAKITNTKSASALAKMYIGLLAGPTGSKTPTDYINVKETQNLIAAFGKKDRFAGIMLWDGTSGSNNKASDLGGKRYWNIVKAALYKNYPPKTKREISQLSRARHHHMHRTPELIGGSSI